MQHFAGILTSVALVNGVLDVGGGAVGIGEIGIPDVRAVLVHGAPGGGDVEHAANAKSEQRANDKT